MEGRGVIPRTPLPLDYLSLGFLKTLLIFTLSSQKLFLNLANLVNHPQTQFYETGLTR